MSDSGNRYYTIKKIVENKDISNEAVTPLNLNPHEGDGVSLERGSIDMGLDQVDSKNPFGPFDNGP